MMELDEMVGIVVCLIALSAGPADDAAFSAEAKGVESEIEFPLRGEWAVLVPPAHEPHAFDFLAVDGPSKRYFSKNIVSLLIGTMSAKDSYSWSQPVFSPVDGTVIESSETWPDRLELNLFRDLFSGLILRFKKFDTDIRPFAGNYVIIKSGSIFAFLAHLQSGSLRVSAGQHVTRGTLIGEVGNSGNSLVPHLHFQLMDGPHRAQGNTIPFRISRYERWNGSSWDMVLHGALSSGETIRLPERK